MRLTACRWCLPSSNESGREQLKVTGRFTKTTVTRVFIELGERQEKQREEGALGLKNTVIYIVSDSLGETAEFVVKAAASQFNSGGFEVRRVSYVSDRSVIEDVVEEAGAMKSVIAYTLVLPGLKAILEELAHARNIPTVDILGPMLQALQSATRLEPKMQAGLLHRLDEQYFRRIEAIEFAIKYDDGKHFNAPDAC